MSKVVEVEGGGDREKCFANNPRDAALSFQLYCKVLPTVTVLVCSVFV